MNKRQNPWYGRLPVLTRSYQDRTAVRFCIFSGTTGQFRKPFKALSLHHFGTMAYRIDISVYPLVAVPYRSFPRGVV